MHRLVLVAALLLAAQAAPALAQGEPVYRPPQPPRGAKVAVYRGNVRQGAPPVAIYRGSAAPPARPAPISASPLAGAVPVAGRRLWLVDSAGDRLVACRLARSLQVGRRVIRCTEGQHPLD